METSKGDKFVRNEFEQLQLASGAGQDGPA